MSTGYSWEGIRQVRATLLGVRHVPERLCGGYVYLGRYIKCSTHKACAINSNSQALRAPAGLGLHARIL